MLCSWGEYSKLDTTSKNKLLEAGAVMARKFYKIIPASFYTGHNIFINPVKSTILIDTPDLNYRIK
jgi:hypothetical protein